MGAKLKAARNISHDIKSKMLKSRWVFHTRFSTGKNRLSRKNNTKVYIARDRRTFWREIPIMQKKIDIIKNNDTK